MISILHENNIYITPLNLNMYFSFYHNISVFIHFRGRRGLLLFNGILLFFFFSLLLVFFFLFAQEIPKELILLCMDYDVALKLKKC